MRIKLAQESSNLPSGCFQRFEAVEIVPPTTTCLEYECFEDSPYYSFEKNAFTGGGGMVSKQTKNTRSGCFAHDDVSYESFQDNVEWVQMRSVLLWEQQQGDFPYYAIDERARDCESGSTRFHGEDPAARGETGVYSLARKLEALMSDWLDKFGCGKVSSAGDNDLAPGVGIVPNMGRDE